MLYGQAAFNQDGQLLPLLPKMPCSYLLQGLTLGPIASANADSSDPQYEETQLGTILNVH